MAKYMFHVKHNRVKIQYLNMWILLKFFQSFIKKMVILKVIVSRETKQKLKKHIFKMCLVFIKII